MMLLWCTIYTALCVRGIQGWYAVLKVGGQGLDNDVSLAELWTDNDVMNDDQAAMVQDTYKIKEMPSYKSNIVNSLWNKVRLAKIGVYKDGTEAAYFIFNATGTTKTTWFNCSMLIETSYTDLTYPAASCVLHHENTTRTFSIISSSEEANCTLYGGWLMTVDDGSSSKCHWEYGHLKPFFLYSHNRKAVPFHNGSSVADSFVVFVDDCVSGPCQQGGTCTPSKNDYTCQCVDQLYGKSCHINCPCQAGKCVSVTQDDVTGNGVVVDGVFINQSPVYPEAGVMVACKCEKGVEGPYCNKSVDDCILHSCINGGMCIDGDNSYTCACPAGFSGDRCQVSEKSLQGHTNKDSLVAKVALGVVIPVVVLLVAAAVAYGVYMYRHPDKFGRSATYKNYIVAREFVRRSIRRMSGRRQREKLVPNGNAAEDKENEASDSAKSNVDASHVNLGFQEGDERQYKSAVPVYKRENSEFYNLSPTDAAVVAGPDAYEMGPSQGGDANLPVESKTTKPRQLGRAYRNKSNSSAPRSPNDAQPSPLTPGNTQQQPLPSPRTPGYNTANTTPSPRTPDVSNYPKTPTHPQDLSAPDDDEDFGFKPKPPTRSSSKPPSTSSYSSADRHIPDQRQEPRSGYDASQQRSPHNVYADHGAPQNNRYDDRSPGEDPRDRYNAPHAGFNAGGRADSRDIYNAAHSPRDQYNTAHSPRDQYNTTHSPRDQYVNRTTHLDPRDRYNSPQTPQDRYGDRSPAVDPGDRYNVPHGDRPPRGIPGNRNNIDYTPPSHDRYNTPRNDPADRYNDRYRDDYQPSRSPRHVEQSQYDYRQQGSPHQTGSEHTRIVFPPSDGMDEVTI